MVLWGSGHVRKLVWQAILIFSLIMSCGTAAEELHFATRSIDLPASPADQELRATFTFTHVGSSPITVTGSRPSCGCLAVLSGTSTYQPGDSGTIETIFTVGQRTGLQQKAIFLTTTSTSEPEIALTLNVHLPEGPQFKPAVVVFSREKPTEQLISIVIPPASPYRITGASSQNDQIETRLIPGASPLEWTLAVAAKPNCGPLTTVIEVDAEPTKKFFVFAKVEKP